MRRKRNNFNKIVFILLVVLLSLFLINNIDSIKSSYGLENKTYELNNIPVYSKDIYVYLNNNEPNFTKKDLTTTSFENYSSLDSLGRCGVAFANIGIDLMPKEERKSISSITPTGWVQNKYDHISGKYLYNRCHLIGFQLTGENANKNNLITCTKQANTKGMLEFENKVATYIKETSNHVLYRVTPVFIDNNLLASGIQIEALSVEDNGEGIKFNVYIYNAEEGVTINYLTGENESDKN